MNEPVELKTTVQFQDISGGMTKQVVDLLVRHLFTLACGIMVRKGYMDADETSIIVGSMLGIAGVALSVYHKWLERKHGQLATI